MTEEQIEPVAAMAALDCAKEELTWRIDIVQSM